MKRLLAAQLLTSGVAPSPPCAAPLARPGAGRGRAGRRVGRAWRATRCSRRRRCSSTSAPGPATRTTSAGCARTSSGCGTRGSSRTCRSTSPTGRRARSSRSGWRSASGSRSSTTAARRTSRRRTSRTSSRSARRRSSSTRSTTRRRRARSSRSSRRCSPRRAAPSRTVKHEAKNIGGAGQQLSFVITDGPKAKIKEISFDGNTVFSDAKLRGKLKNLKAAGALQPQLARGEDDLHRAEVAGRGREGPARRPGAARGLLPRQRLRHGARRAAPHHVLRRQAGQEEADEVHEDRDPGHRGRRSTGSAR